MARSLTPLVFMLAPCATALTVLFALVQVLPPRARLAGPSVRPALRAGPGSADGLSRRVLRDLKRDLRDRYPDKRRRAVEKLAALDIPEAWALVLGALADDDPQVADEAQLRLAEWSDSREVLLGKEGLGSRDELVRLRVAESYGRRTERVDAAALVRRIDPRDARVARMVLWSLERLAEAGRLHAVEGPLERRISSCMRANLDPLLRADALRVLARVQRGHPAQVRALLAELAADRAPAVRCAALAVNEDLGGDRVGEFCAGALADGATAVRSQAIACLVRRADGAAVQALAGALDREERPRLRAELVAALQQMTGRRWRDDPQAWKRFAARLPAGWRAGADGRSLGEAADRPEQTVAFAGLPLRSDRVCFLVDFSGSLWREGADGRTPKDVVDRELAAALAALPEGTRFNVVPYTREPHPWRARVVENRPARVADALRYFERCKETGPGSFFEAARFALADPDVDEIVVLTDGAPTGGEHWNLGLLFDLLVHENRHRRVVFDAVLVDAGQRLVEAWSEFAERTGGQCLAVRLDAEEAVLRPR